MKIRNMKAFPEIRFFRGMIGTAFFFFNRILVGFLLASLLFLGASPPTASAEVPAELSKALKEGESFQALSLARSWAEEAENAEDKAMALWLEARILSLYRGDPLGAEAALFNLINSFPETSIYPDACYEQAVLMAQKGNKERAINELTAFIVAFPDHPRRRSAGILLASLKGGGPDIAQGKADTIRVLLDFKDDFLYMKGLGLYAWDGNTGKGVYLGDEIYLDMDEDGQIQLNGTPVPQPLHVDQKHDFFFINGKRYRGNLRVDSESGRFFVVNILGLENYLRGVVPAEMPPSWPTEALKAQAIAARSFAMYHMGRQNYTIYDLRADTRSQMYSAEAEDARTDDAVLATMGEILVWEGAPALAAFHADSGGRTEASSHVWGGAYPYLASFHDQWTKGTPYMPWQYSVDEKNLLERIPQLRKLGTIQEIRTSGQTPSGRVRDLIFKGRWGEVRLSATEFRNLAGPQLIKSTNFSVTKVSGGNFSFEGKGYGHGVGMSQWGAKKMAEAGKTNDEILKYYYPYLKTAKVIP
ncbi:SpoIID/LytB domain-containing protein [Desulfococcaceae bacterium OttesenSCG-928-F15]|nr:SpoIID/LytB domain-containing protein [Desulfococcaceae bacterium OttesenSCG-928-F15]